MTRNVTVVLLTIALSGMFQNVHLVHFNFLRGNFSKNNEASSSSALKENAETPPDEANDSKADGGMLCNVCWDKVPTEYLCFCDCSMVPPKSESDANGVNDNDRNRNSANDNQNANIEHAFCKECLVQYTKAAQEEMPFAKSGLGLRCMVPKCENPIAWREIKALNPDDMSIEKLQERCEELSIIHSGIYLESCQKCNYTVGMDVPPEKEIKFCCPKCNCVFCRKCDEEWEEKHNDLSCKQFAKQQQKSYRKKLLFQHRLSEVVVHKCHRCKLQFVKSGGCNFIECKCGARQCYACGGRDISYSHYCPTFESSGEILDERAMERVRKEYADSAAKGKFKSIFKF